MTLPGLPFIYYGEEIGMSGDKPDERIRTPMQWSGESGGGFTTSQPWQPLQGDEASVNVATQDGDPLSLLSLYRRLVQLHAAHPALGHGEFVPVRGSEPSVTAYLRMAGDDVVLVVLNFDDEEADNPTFSIDPGALPPGQFRAETLLGGIQAPPITVAEDGTMSIGPRSIDIAAEATWVYALHPMS